MVVIFSSRVQLGKGGRNPTTRKKTNQAAHNKRIKARLKSVSFTRDSIDSVANLN